MAKKRKAVVTRLQDCRNHLNLVAKQPVDRENRLPSLRPRVTPDIVPARRTMRFQGTDRSIYQMDVYRGQSTFTLTFTLILTPTFAPTFTLTLSHSHSATLTSSYQTQSQVRAITVTHLWAITITHLSSSVIIWKFRVDQFFPLRSVLHCRRSVLSSS